MTTISAHSSSHKQDSQTFEQKVIEWGFNRDCGDLFAKVAHDPIIAAQACKELELDKKYQQYEASIKADPDRLTALANAYNKRPQSIVYEVESREELKKLLNQLNPPRS